MHNWSDFGIDVNLQKSGNQFIKCPVCADVRRKSKSKTLGADVDDKIWGCNHCGFSGSLYKGVTNPGNVHKFTKGELKSRRAPKEYIRPKFEVRSQYPKEITAFFKTRGISEKTLLENKIGFCKTKFSAAEDDTIPLPAIQFPFIKLKEVVNIKFRGPNKLFKQSYNAEKVVYGFDDIIGKKEIIFVEGEIDKLSWNEIGIKNVCSVPDGAPSPQAQDYTSKFDFLESIFDTLEGAERIILAVDDDEAGETLLEELARRVGKEKCYMVSYPPDCKDSNEVLVKHGAEALKQLYESAYRYPIAGIITVEDYEHKIDKIFAEGIIPGFKLHWNELKYKPALGEFTTVTGVPGSGKSELIDCILIDLAKNHKCRIGLNSPEHPTEIHMIRIMEKIINKPMYINTTENKVRVDLKRGPQFINLDEYVYAKEFMNDWFFWISHEYGKEKMNIKTLNEKKTALIRRYGVSIFVDDPYNKMEHARPSHQTETDYISEFLDEYAYFNKTNHTHSFLVAHPSVKGIRKIKQKIAGKDVEVWPIITPSDIGGCYSDDTEILTKNGWILHSEWKKEQILCFDLETNTTQWSKPEKLNIYDFKGEMHHFKSRSFDIMVTPDHRMVIKNEYHNRDILNQNDPRIIDRDWRFEYAKDINIHRFYIPNAAACISGQRMNVAALDSGYNMDLLLKIIGWFISEGWYTMGSFAICQQEGEIANEMEATFEALGIKRTTIRNKKPKRQRDKAFMYITRVLAKSHPSLCWWIIEHCGKGAENKKIPAIVWKLCNEQKEILLKALMQGDGSINKKDEYVAYYTCSKQLAFDVQKLAIELGYPTSYIEEKSTNPNWMDRYIIRIGNKNRDKLCVKRSKIKMTPYNGKVYCFTVETGAYVTRRNGKVAFQGNSSNWWHKSLNCLSVYRTGMSLGTQAGKEEPTLVIVQKVKFKWNGELGSAKLFFNEKTGNFTENAEPEVPQPSNDSSGDSLQDELKF